jgi:membrane protein insertase Oxa1/YidC/SpoIIIJ
MNYLYYTLYVFYTKIIKIQKYDTPHFNICLVIGTLESFFFLSFYNLYLLNTVKENINYPYYLGIVLGVSMFAYNWYYYKTRGKKITKFLGNKPKKTKTKIILIVTPLIILIISFWFYTGHLIRLHNIG